MRALSNSGEPYRLGSSERFVPNDPRSNMTGEQRWASYQFRTNLSEAGRICGT